MKLLSLAAIFSFSLSAFAQLTIYTDRPASRFKNAAAAYTQATGEQVVFAEMGFKDIVKLLETEGSATPANVVITKDVIYLAELSDKNLLRPMTPSPALETVNEFMRDKDLKWVGVTFRARSVAYSPSRVNPAEIVGYEDLATEKWAGRLCLRTGKAAYNEALVASLIVSHGEAKTTEILEGWLANLATDIFPDDLKIVAAISNGQCDVGIINHYYLAMALDNNPNLDVKYAFADQAGLGVHTNGMGAGLTAANKNANAQKFIELLLTPENQLTISAAHFDFPAVKGLAPNTFIKEWGSFKMNSANWGEIGSKATVARDLIREAGYQ
ncbi:MAG: extracellular solute-binding protein [Bdellovibrionales bacterium]|nr:extracellular solute-binding protein [Bdellovibrionales bacterium]